MTYDILRQAVLNGTFAPGEHLRQDALARRLGVSRLPVRSALLKLDSEGLVSYHPHSGARVATLAANHLKEIYEIRLLLETYLLRQAMENRSDAWIDSLEEAAAAVDSAEPGPSFIELRYAFYDQLYSRAGHPIAMKLLDRLRQDLGRYFAALRVTDRKDTDHRDLLRFVKAGDEDGSVKWLDNHLKDVRESLLSLLGERP